MDINVRVEHHLGQVVYWVDLLGADPEIKNATISKVITRTFEGVTRYYYETNENGLLMNVKLLSSYEDALNWWNEIRKGVIN